MTPLRPLTFILVMLAVCGASVPSFAQNFSESQRGEIEKIIKRLSSSQSRFA